MKSRSKLFWNIILNWTAKGDMTLICFRYSWFKDFFTSFLSKQDFLPQIMAVKRYDHNSREIIYDNKIYIAETNNGLENHQVEG